MAKTSNIEWTDATWNIARGCTKVNDDCKFCYMYRDSLNKTRYNPQQVTRTKTVFNLPLKLENPSMIFMSSLTDVFHPDIDSYRHEAFDIIRKSPQHTFQMLTKLPQRIMQHLPPDWGDGWDNVWLGTSVGSQESIHRMELLSMIPAKIKFLSLEPLHGPVELKKAMYYSEPLKESFHVLPAYDWVIIGGESGNEKGQYRYRECKIEWIESLIAECKENNIPVFIKQLGTHLAKQLKLKDRHGKNIDEWPEHLRIREFPKTSF